MRICCMLCTPRPQLKAQPGSAVKAYKLAPHCSQSAACDGQSCSLLSPVELTYRAKLVQYTHCCLPAVAACMAAPTRGKAWGVIARLGSVSLAAAGVLLVAILLTEYLRYGPATANASSQSLHLLNNNSIGAGRLCCWLVILLLTLSTKRKPWYVPAIDTLPASIAMALMQKGMQCREVQYHMQQLLQQLLASDPALLRQLAQMQILQCLKVMSFTSFPPKTLLRLSTRTHGGVRIPSPSNPQPCS